jgi:hypothetical protein
VAADLPCAFCTGLRLAFCHFAGPAFFECGSQELADMADFGSIRL